MLAAALLSGTIVLNPVFDAANLLTAAGAGADGPSPSAMLRGALTFGLVLGCILLRAPIIPRPILPIVLLAVHLLFVDAVMGVPLGQSLTQAFRFAALVAAFSCAHGFQRALSPKPGWFIRRAFLSLALSLAFLGLSSTVEEIPSPYGAQHKYVGLASNVSLTAAQVVAVIPFFALLPLTNATGVCGRLASLLALLLTLRRSAILAWITAFAVADARGRRRWATLCFLALLILVALLAWPRIRDSSTGDLISQRISDLDWSSDSAGSGRKTFWLIAVDDISSRTPLEILFGAGTIRTQEVMQERFGAAIGAHNDFLDWLLAGGVLGLSLYVWFLIGVFSRLRHSLDDPTNRSLAAGLVAMVTLALTSGSSLAPSMTPLFVFFGQALACVPHSPEHALSARTTAPGRR